MGKINDGEGHSVDAIAKCCKVLGAAKLIGSQIKAFQFQDNE